MKSPWEYTVEPSVRIGTFIRIASSYRDSSTIYFVPPKRGFGLRGHARSLVRLTSHRLTP
jgi:hypothetical protein